jgi:prolyl-tRNA synthetase
MSRDEVLNEKGVEESATTATSVAAKTLCKPFEHPPLPEGTLCFVSGLPAKAWVLWGRSY